MDLEGRGRVLGDLSPPPHKFLIIHIDITSIHI